ncbi:hypothetical protein BLNAU_23343 [Blattamonas nauphoetae]|uniref:Uncharacterized protein n=1 Tax=Blattamonas nauphoetae TaxID=2049346 RepID=A0ABQ9WSN0_9EUKA|nr:hypothetical protein BLNAU_23343 [Blattamonas nauphoetae]
MSSFENVDLTITRLSIDVSTPNQSPILLSLAVKPTKPPYRAHSPVPRASTPQAQNNVQSKERMEAERRVEEAKARQREILTQQALEKERQRAEELVKKQQAAYAAAAEAQGQRMEQLRRQEAAKEAERRRQAAEMEQRRREAESRAAEAREQKMREMKAREDRERMIREEARLNFFNQQEQARRNKMAIDAKMDGSNAPLRFTLQKKKSPSSFPPLEDYFIKPKQAASLAKPKRLLQRQFEKITAPAPKQAPPKSAERRSLSARRVTPTVADRPKTGSPLSDRPKSTDKQKMQKVIFQFGELQGMLQRAASPAPRKRRNQLHNKNKVDDKKQREYEEKLKQLELEKKAQAGDKPWLTRGKSKEEKALEEEKRRIEQEMKDDEEAERRKVVKEAQMREREKREAERKAFQKLIAKKKKKKQNRSHSVGDEEDVVILVAPNRLNAHPQQRKHQLLRLQPAQATPKKVAATSKEGSPQATHTPPKIGSSKGKVEREKEKRSEDVQRSSPFANVERGG